MPLSYRSVLRDINPDQWSYNNPLTLVRVLTLGDTTVIKDYFAHVPMDSIFSQYLVHRSHIPSKLQHHWDSILGVDHSLVPSISSYEQRISLLPSRRFGPR